MRPAGKNEEKRGDLMEKGREPFLLTAAGTVCFGEELWQWALSFVPLSVFGFSVFGLYQGVFCWANPR